jgi:hypothetical protein
MPKIEEKTEPKISNDEIDRAKPVTDNEQGEAERATQCSCTNQF